MNVPKNKTDSVADLSLRLRRHQPETAHAMNLAERASFRSDGPAMNAAETQIPDSTQICIVCQREIVDSLWFCRLPQNHTAFSNGEFPKHLICNPHCALRHFGTSRLQPNGYEQDYISAERSFYMLIGPEILTFI